MGIIIENVWFLVKRFNFVFYKRTPGAYTKTKVTSLLPPGGQPGSSVPGDAKGCGWRSSRGWVRVQCLRPGFCDSLLGEGGSGRGTGIFVVSFGSLSASAELFFFHSLPCGYSCISIRVWIPRMGEHGFSFHSEQHWCRPVTHSRTLISHPWAASVGGPAIVLPQ